MNPLHVRIRWLCRRWPRAARLVQVAVLVALCALCNLLAPALHLPVPGSVLGLGVVLALLALGVVPAAGLRQGADWLLAEMLLFFIPAVMAVSQHVPLLRDAGVRIVLVIVIGTVLVMVSTALLVDRVCRWQRRHG